VTALIAATVAVWIAREQQRGDVLALGLVLGGALGNIVDRVRFGYVVDFLHLFWRDYNFWVFNVADAAISIGVLLLLTRAVLTPQK
jgi:signal peptidase II